jgi:AAA+ superfamily predicted ATPase
MLTLDDCIAANRPCIFICCESDVEVLRYLNDKFNKNNYSVYSTTLARVVKLSDLIKSKFLPVVAKSDSTLDVLHAILTKPFHDTSSNTFETIVFLDADSFINDRQIIRKIKDILSRYQLDTDYTLNLIFVSQTVCVPPQLERLSEVVFYNLPNEQQLKEQSDIVVEKLELKKDQKPTDDVVKNLKGLTLFETEQAYIQSWQLHQSIDIDFIRNFKKAAINKTDLLSLLESDITFNDIGGMDRLKSWIIKSSGAWTVEGQKFNLPLMKGVLLVGPPGTGKSLLAKSIGNEWKLPVVQFDPSRIFSSRVGESESNVHRILKIIETISPCICFIDEIEKAMAGVQSSTFSDSGVTARVVGSFLQWFQDCTEPVFIVGTSNGIQYLPPELISRFDEVFFVNLPQQVERRDIFSIHLKKINRDPNKFNLTQLSENSDNFTGREIAQIVKESLYDAFHSKKELTTEHILNVLRKKTNIIVTMTEQMNLLFKWVGWDEEKKDGIRARYSSVPSDLEITKIQSEIDSIIGDIEKGK